VFEEIRRVLVAGRRFVTVQPAILARKTVTRCGIELLDEIQAAGPDVSVYFYSVSADDDTWGPVCRKTGA
jgi:hypothetical protein